MSSAGGFVVFIPTCLIGMLRWGFVGGHVFGGSVALSRGFIAGVRRLLPPVVTAAVVLSLVWWAVSAAGYPLRQLDLNDTGIWVSNNAGGEYGRINKAVGGLDARLSPPGARLPSYELDILQDGNQVLGWDQTSATVTAIDTATQKSVEEQSIGVDTTGSVQVRGGTVAVLSRSGKVWATRYDPLDGAATLTGLAGSNKPLADLGLADGDAAASMAVSKDGTVFVADTRGRLLTLRPAEGTFTVSESTPWSTMESVALTSVGDIAVALDAAAGILRFVGGRSVTVPGDSVLRVQEPGPAAPTVLVASAKALMRVGLESGQVTTVDGGGDGAPAVPVHVGGCDFGAWAGKGRVVRACDGAGVEVQQVDRTGGLIRPAFRMNHGLVLLNDQANGRAWDLDAQRSIDNWPDVNPQGSQRQVQERQAEASQAKPHAVDDDFKARSDRTTVLHVLDNDTDTAGGLLSIVAVNAASVPDGVDVEIAPDGQTIKLFLPRGTSPVKFGYTISNGRVTDEGQVRVRDAGDQETAPYQVSTLGTPKYSVTSFGTVSMAVLPSWRDAEGDPVTVLSARDGSAAVAVGADGALEYTAEQVNSDQLRTLTYSVSDGAGAAAKTGVVKVRVLARKSLTAVAATAQPDTARGQVGQPITVFPLANDIPGADPRNVNATLMLNGPVAQKANLTVRTDAKTGQVQVVAAREGPYFLEYSAAYGSAAVAKGIIRVDALAQGADQPVAMPDQATVRGRVPVLIDVLGNDYDPTGQLLTVQSVTPTEPGQLSAQVVAGRWIRILPQAERLSPNPQAVHYEITNGSQSARGDVLVTQLPEVDEDTVLAKSDAATVRVGDSTLIDVLANDASMAGQRLSLAVDGLGVDAVGELPVVDPALPAGADQGDVGHAFIHGDEIRYVAPAVVDGSRQVVVSYTAQTPDGATAQSRVLVSIHGEPSEADPDRAPSAGNVEMRVVSGSRVKIPIPTSGQDPDGDTVTVAGIHSGPSLGRVVGYSPNSITYEAFPTEGLVGTDSFEYVVADKYGRTGTGTVQIAVTDPGQTQAPVAIDDQYVAAPGMKVHANVTTNDFIARDDKVSLASMSRVNSPVPDGVSAETDIGPIAAVAPGAKAQPVVFNYALVGNGGTGPQGKVTITAREGFNNPPVAVDHNAEVDGAYGTAHLLADVWDVEDGTDGLKAEVLAKVEGLTLIGDQVRVPLTGNPQVIPYRVTDSGGAVSAAVLYVPAAGTVGPQLKPQGSISMKSDSTASFAISDYVESPRTKIVKISRGEASAAPVGGLSASVTDANRFTLTSTNGYVGPASVTIEVMDADSQTAEGVLTAVVSIPVQIGAPTPVLRCPQDAQSVVQGGEIKNLDITSLCHVWTPDPATAGQLAYTAQWATPIDGVTAKADGGTVSLQASGNAPDHGEGVVRIGIAGTGAKTADIPVTVIAASAPQLRSVKLSDVMAGTVVNVPMSVSSPLLDAAPAVVKVSQISGGKATVTHSGATVSVTPAQSTSGTLVFSVVATDLVADAGRESRWVTGTLTIAVYSAPAAPSAPRSDSVIQSHAASLTWTAGKANGATIDSYQVKISSGPNAGRTMTSRSTSLQATGLANGKAVTFQVQAHNKAGWSPWSQRSGPIIPDTAPGAPAWVKVSDPQDHSVLVSWGTIANDGSPVTTVHVRVDGVDKPVGAGLSSTRVSTASNNESYTFSVTAENAYDLGPSVSVRGQSSGRPAGLSVNAPKPARAVGATTPVSVSWKRVSPEGPEPVTYTVARSDGKKICTTVALQCTDDTVTYNGKSYTYSVTATNATGGAAHSSTAKSPAFAATGTPDGWGSWSVVPTGDDGKAKLTYTVPPSRGSTSKVVLHRSGKSNVTAPSPGPNGGAASFTTTGLTDGTQTTLTLEVCNEAGRCTSSAARTVTTFGDLSTPKVSATHSDDKVTGSASGNGNGATATLTLYIDGVKMGSTSGKGSLSISKTRTVGYSQKVTVKAVLTSSNTTPSRADKSASTTETTGAKPPPPSVSIWKGERLPAGICRPEYNGNGDCWWVGITRKNFTKSQTCKIYNLSPKYLGTTTSNSYSDNGTDSTGWIGVGSGNSTGTYAVCNGVKSNVENW